jgi:hypothetical protein
MVTDKQIETAQGIMKRYVDPRTGTVTYSGADMTAIVNMPVSANELGELIKKKRTELELLEDDLRTYNYTYVALSAARDDALDTDSRKIAEIALRKIRPSQLFNYSDRVWDASQEIARLEKLHRLGGNFSRPVKLFDLQTISISSHREKFPVRTLGRIGPKSRTRGPRTIAGSLIFTLFNKTALWDLLQASSNFYSSGVGIGGSDSGYPEMSTVLVDQLPPFDMTILCSNELGDNSYMALYGIEISNEGLTLSIQDIITEDVMQFTALDWEPMRPLSMRRQLVQEGIPIITPDNYIKEGYTERQRRGIRLNPFV